MKTELGAIAQEDGVAIPATPRSLSWLAERYLSDHGGYLLYAMLNRAGAHPSAARAFLFYGNPETGVTDYDFKRMFDQRAHWSAVAIQLHLDLCDLISPVLGWPDWQTTSSDTRHKLAPLAEEADRRYSDRWRRALIKAHASSEAI
jgi:hypothetical protein